MKIPTITGKLLARNTVLNMVGQIIPLVVGILTIPYIIQGMGKERFGLLSLIWVVLGYFTIFDLGLGRATTKYVAELFGRGETTKVVSNLVQTAVIIQAIFGIVGALVVAGGTHLLVDRILNISLSLRVEARTAFYVLSLSVPIVLISTSFSGLLEAAQRFDLINAVRVPSSVATFLIPLFGSHLSWTLPKVIGALIIVKCIAMVIYFIMGSHFVPEIKRPGALQKNIISQLVTFGGWITIANICAPLLRYLDRFVIGALISTAFVAYYSIPFDMMERLWIIPYSLVLTLFPAFSALSGLENQERTQELFFRSIKYLFAVVTPIILLLIIFAEQILLVWLGVDFVQNSLVPFQILAIGAMIGIIAPIAGAILQGYNRPDIVSKIYLVMLPVNFLLVWYLTKNLGLIGAALSFAIRTCCETIILVLLTIRIVRLRMTPYLRSVPPILILVPLTILSLWLAGIITNAYIRILSASAIIILFFATMWKWGFSETDRTILKSFVKGRLT